VFYGWDQNFEILVTQIVADILSKYNPTKEHIWIAEMGGEVVGSIFLVQSTEEVAKTAPVICRALPSRAWAGKPPGAGMYSFCQQLRYHKITLWTNQVLKPARHIYQKNGFRLVSQEERFEFGQSQVEETWELDLKN